MKIYIPTRGRVERQTTWDGLPPELKDAAVLVCSSAEATAHLERNRNVLVCPEEGIIRKRQWIMDKSWEDKLIMLDDDLIFLRRKDQGAWNLARCSPNDTKALFFLVEELLDVFPQVGVSPRQGNNRFFPETLVTCNRVTNFHGYDTKIMREAGIKFHDPMFPATFTMEDFHVSLSLLSQGYQNAIVTDFAWDQHGSNSAGGCALYRTADTQRQSAQLLAARHPGLVRVTEKETKGGWGGVASAAGGGIRTDVVISWKKAYDQAVTRAA